MLLWYVKRCVRITPTPRALFAMLSPLSSRILSMLGTCLQILCGLLWLAVALCVAPYLSLIGVVMLCILGGLMGAWLAPIAVLGTGLLVLMTTLAAKATWQAPDRLKRTLWAGCCVTSVYVAIISVMAVIQLSSGAPGQCNFF